jgi:hypothetical protein
MQRRAVEHMRAVGDADVLVSSDQARTDDLRQAEHDLRARTSRQSRKQGQADDDSVQRSLPQWGGRPLPFGFPQGRFCRCDGSLLSLHVQKGGGGADKSAASIQVGSRGKHDCVHVFGIQLVGAPPIG